jgi:hypothetical protein
VYYQGLQKKNTELAYQNALDVCSPNTLEFRQLNGFQRNTYTECKAKGTRDAIV